MDKRGLMALLMVFLLMVSVGCQLGTGLRVNQKQKEEVSETVYKGVKGLTMQFVKNNPPRVIYTTTPLSIIIELRNQGTHNIANGRLYLSGVDQHIIDITPNQEHFNLEGKSKYNLYGGLDVVAFESRGVNLPRGTDLYEPTILASACYEYKTSASPLVCIDPDPYSALEQEACKVKDISMAGGQGAPVAVTRVEEEAIPGRVNFRIHIANQDTGVVMDNSAYTLNKCPGKLQHNDLDTVYYSVRMGNNLGDCNPDDKIKLVDKKGTIYCSFQVPTSEQAYQTILNIDLMYGYLSQISQRVEIRSIS